MRARSAARGSLFSPSSIVSSPSLIRPVMALQGCGSALIPRTPRVRLPAVAGASGVIEILVHEAGRGRNAADGEGGLAQALQGSGESFHMGNFPRHQEL